MEYLVLSGYVVEFAFKWIPNYIQGAYDAFCAHNPDGDDIHDYPASDQFEFSIPAWAADQSKVCNIEVQYPAITFALLESADIAVVNSPVPLAGYTREDPIPFQSQDYLHQSGILGPAISQEHECGPEKFVTQSRTLYRGAVSIHIPINLVSIPQSEWEISFDGTLTSLGVRDSYDNQIEYWESPDGYDIDSDWAKHVGCGKLLWCNVDQVTNFEWRDSELDALAEFITTQTWDDESNSSLTAILDQFESELDEEAQQSVHLKRIRDFLG